MKKRKEICASFTVEDENRKLKKVVVIQDILSHYRKEEKYSKKFSLDYPDGPVVFQTENPDVYQLIDGTILKRRKR